jgi:hypothetical protein
VPAAHQRRSHQFDLACTTNDLLPDEFESVGSIPGSFATDDGSSFEDLRCWTPVVRRATCTAEKLAADVRRQRSHRELGKQLFTLGVGCPGRIAEHTVWGDGNDTIHAELFDNLAERLSAAGLEPIGTHSQWVEMEHERRLGSARVGIGPGQSGNKADHIVALVGQLCYCPSKGFIISGVARDEDDTLVVMASRSCELNQHRMKRVLTNRKRAGERLVFARRPVREHWCYQAVFELCRQ